MLAGINPVMIQRLQVILHFNILSFCLFFSNGEEQREEVFELLNPDIKLTFAFH